MWLRALQRWRPLESTPFPKPTLDSCSSGSQRWAALNLGQGLPVPSVPDPPSLCLHMGWRGGYADPPNSSSPLLQPFQAQWMMAPSSLCVSPQPLPRTFLDPAHWVAIPDVGPCCPPGDLTVLLAPCPVPSRGGGQVAARESNAWCKCSLEVKSRIHTKNRGHCSESPSSLPCQESFTTEWQLGQTSAVRYQQL